MEVLMRFTHFELFAVLMAVTLSTVAVYAVWCHRAVTRAERIPGTWAWLNGQIAGAREQAYDDGWADCAAGYERLLPAPPGTGPGDFMGMEADTPGPASGQEADEADAEADAFLAILHGDPRPGDRPPPDESPGPGQTFDIDAAMRAQDTDAAAFIAWQAVEIEQWRNQFLDRMAA
jgi:hypothetical protein